MGLHSKGRLQALPTNIGLGWKGLTATNALAYFWQLSIAAEKLFNILVPDLEKDPTQG